MNEGQEVGNWEGFIVLSQSTICKVINKFSECQWRSFRRPRDQVWSCCATDVWSATNNKRSRLKLTNGLPLRKLRSRSRHIDTVLWVNWVCQKTTDVLFNVSVRSPLPTPFSADDRSLQTSFPNWPMFSQGWALSGGTLRSISPSSVIVAFTPPFSINSHSLLPRAVIAWNIDWLLHYSQFFRFVIWFVVWTEHRAIWLLYSNRLIPICQEAIDRG